MFFYVNIFTTTEDDVAEKLLLFKINLLLLLLKNKQGRTLLFKEAFRDSKITKKYASHRTKTPAIINKPFVSHCLDYIVKHCKSHHYSAQLVQMVLMIQISRT